MMRRTTFIALLLVHALGACGQDERPRESTRAVFTTEREAVSRWVNPELAGVDTAALQARSDPRGDGVLVYGPSDAAGRRAVWRVRGSEVTALTEGARRASPTLPGTPGGSTAVESAAEEAEYEALLRDEASPAVASDPAAPAAPGVRAAEDPRPERGAAVPPVAAPGTPPTPQGGTVPPSQDTAPARPSGSTRPPGDPAAPLDSGRGSPPAGTTPAGAHPGGNPAKSAR